MIDQQALPIGVFDSGVGGLTVLRAMCERLPHENFLYMGDTARLPYGTKSQDTIIRYSLQTTAKLVERGIKMLVIACGTASSAALPILRQHYAPLPVIGVIEPGAAAAVAASACKHVAIIATEASIRGKAYEHAIHACDPSVRVTSQPCTLFVALAEEGWTSGPLVEGIAARYLSEMFAGSSASAGDQAPLPSCGKARTQSTQGAQRAQGEISKASAGPDTLLLGCTHFPPLRAALQNVVGPHIKLVDSATTTAEAVFQSLHASGLAQKNGQHSSQRTFLTTDDVERFQRTGSLFFGASIAHKHIELVDL